MAGRFTDADARLILNNRLGGLTATVTGTHYLGLSTTVPNPDGTGFTEPVGNGYARVTIANNATNWPSLTTGRGPKTNGQPFVFPTAAADWGIIVAYLLFDHLTNAAAANLRAYGLLDSYTGAAGSGTAVLAGETRSFPVGAISLTAPGT